MKYATGGGTATAGTDYTTVALTTLSFAAGETSKTVTVNVTGDIATEANEKREPVGGIGVLWSPTPRARPPIVNDDFDLPGRQRRVGGRGNAGTTATVFTITRSGNTAGASTVGVAISGGTATAARPPRR